MEAHTLSVLELTRSARQAVSLSFPREVWVEGEIGSISRTARGHVFFDLVEADRRGGPPAASVGVVLFDDVRRQVNAELRATGAVRMTEGVQIRLRGKVDLFERSGRVQVRMSAIDPAHTLGQLAAARAAVLERLAADDLLRRNAERSLPALPLHVGVVTSAGSAAHADVVHELEAAGIGFRVRVCSAQVQGAAAPGEIAAAVAHLARLDVDVVLLVRGGGARTDLAAFDHEVVGRAIATCPVPVLTGVGHEIDETVADVVAHLAAKTPTACAAALVAHARTAIDRLGAASLVLGHVAPSALQRAESRLEIATGRLGRLGGGHLDRAQRHLERHARRSVDAARRATTSADRRSQRAAAVVATLARHQLRAAERRVDDRGAVAAGRARRAVSGADRRVAAHAALVAAADPARALARGWSLTRTADGALVRSVASVAPGEHLVTTVADGDLRSVVEVEP